MAIKTVNLSFPEDLLKKIDRQAKEEYKSRSDLLREATLVYLQSKDNWKVIQVDLRRRAGKLRIEKESQIEEMVDSLRK